MIPAETGLSRNVFAALLQYVIINLLKLWKKERDCVDEGDSDGFEIGFKKRERGIFDGTFY